MTYLEKRQKALQEQLKNLEVQTRDKTLSDDDLKKIQDDVKSINDELDEIQTTLDGQNDDTKEPAVDPEPEPADPSKGDPEAKSKETTDNEDRAKAKKIISRGVNVPNNENEKRREKRARTVFSRMALGQTVDAAETRELGIVSGNGGVTIPTTIQKEILSYDQEENGLRQFGTVHADTTTEAYPVLVKAPVANGHKDEYALTDEMPDQEIQLQDVELNPTEFDALVTFTKKLAHRSGINIENEVITELAKAYTAKEAEFMFTGTDTKNTNDGSLLKKAQVFTPTADNLFDQLVQFKNNAKQAVRKNSMFFLNTAAQTLVETLKDTTGRPLYRSLDAAENGQIAVPDGKLMGFNAHITDYAFADDTLDDTKPAIYFGDFSSFHIQDVLGSMELQVLNELYARSNHIGVQLYNIVDGQLVYSPLQPTMFRLDLSPKA